MTREERRKALDRLKGDTCPVKGCGYTLRQGMLMCAPHWRLVPRPIQTEVVASARNLHSSPSAFDNWLVDAISAVDAAEQELEEMAS